MTDHRQLHVPERWIAPPSSISPEAQAALVRALCKPAAPTPALDDINGWLEYIANTDAAMLPFLTAMAEQAGDVEAEPLRMGRAEGFYVNADAAASERILLDIHGGALISCGGELCKLTAIGAAASLDAAVYAVDYRMPPRDRYPHGLDDCVEAYRFILTRHAPGRIIIRGISAGANLAAATALRARDEGLPLPGGLILGTPELDLTESGDSFRTNEYIDVVLQHPLMQVNLLYAAGHDLADPYLSPLFGDFAKGFPPTVLSTGTRDLFLSNAVRMHNKLRRVGMESELYIEEAMPHGGFFPSPEDTALAADVRGFADRIWGASLDKVLEGG